MENPNSVTPTYEDEIDLWALWETLWSGRWLIIAITGVFTLSGVTYSLLAQEWFEADVVLAPVEKKSIGGGLSQFAGLANLAGLDLPGAGVQEPMAVLKSKEFSRAFIEEQRLLPALLEGRPFDSEAPDIRDGVSVFDNSIRSVTEDSNTGLVTLSIRWKDPETAANWANLLVKLLNERLRTQAEAEASRNVAFLQREIAASSVVSLQQSMGRVLEGEMQKLMLARGNEQFAFKVIDPAVPPKQRQSPTRTLITLVSTIVGGFLGILVVFLRKAIANRPKR